MSEQIAFALWRASQRCYDCLVLFRTEHTFPCGDCKEINELLAQHGYFEKALEWAS